MAESPKTHIEEDLIRALADLLDETGLTEIEYGKDGLNIRVAKNVSVIAGAPMASAMPAVCAPATPTDDGGLSELAAAAAHPGAVKSPMVGICYTSPDPKSPSFVQAGDTVTEGQTLLLIEAMKVFNPITAPKSGTVVQVLVENGTPVEYGEPLLIIE